MELFDKAMCAHIELYCLDRHNYGESRHSVGPRYLAETCVLISDFAYRQLYNIVHTEMGYVLKLLIPSSIAREAVFMLSYHALGKSLRSVLRCRWNHWIRPQL